MTFNHNLINKFLEAIFPLPQEFGVVWDDYENMPIDFPFFKKSINNVDPDASIFFGASKIVICSPNLKNVVIKIPFNGYFIETEENGECDRDWYPFEWATGSDTSDYCLAECEKYHRLKAYGLDCFVAKTFHYKTIDGVRIFLQEKVIPENNLYTIKKPSKKSQELANKWHKEGKIYIKPEWIASCLDKYGESKVERFLHYCTNIDLDILEDLHSGNFGYRNNETPCILDYSNYME